MKYNTDTLKIQLRYIRRSIVPLLLLIALFQTGNRYPFRNWHPLITVESLSDLEIQAESGTRYVELQTETLWYTGSDYITGQDKTGSCYYTILDGQCVFFILSPDHTSDQLDQLKVSGQLLQNTEVTSSITAGMAEDLSWTSTGLNQMSSALLIDSTADNRAFYNACFLLTCLVAALAGLALLRNFFFVLFPGRAKPLKSGKRRITTRRN